MQSEMLRSQALERRVSRLETDLHNSEEIREEQKREMAQESDEKTTMLKGMCLYTYVYVCVCMCEKWHRNQIFVCMYVYKYVYVCICMRMYV